MPTFRPHLTEREWADFAGWARQRPSYQPCPNLAHDGCCIAEIGGWIFYGRKRLTLEDLVDRWRALGKPEPTGRRYWPTHRSHRPDPNGIGARRGAERAQKRGLP